MDDSRYVVQNSKGKVDPNLLTHVGFRCVRAYRALQTLTWKWQYCVASDLVQTRMTNEHVDMGGLSLDSTRKSSGQAQISGRGSSLDRLVRRLVNGPYHKLDPPRCLPSIFFFLLIYNLKFKSIMLFFEIYKKYFENTKIVFWYVIFWYIYEDFKETFGKHFAKILENFTRNFTWP